MLISNNIFDYFKDYEQYMFWLLLLVLVNKFMYECMCHLYYILLQIKNNYILYVLIITNCCFRINTTKYWQIFILKT